MSPNRATLNLKLYGKIIEERVMLTGAMLLLRLQTKCSSRKRQTEPVLHDTEA